jgi:hypothetical protein
MVYKIRELLTLLGNVGKMDITIGVSETLPVECLFILKDKALYDKVETSIEYLDRMAQIPNRTFLAEESIARLLVALGQNLKLLVNLSYNEILDRDCLILFNSPELVDRIYHGKV